MTTYFSCITPLPPVVKPKLLLATCPPVHESVPPATYPPYPLEMPAPVTLVLVTVVVLELTRTP
jgi:hypothetical protein